MLQIVGALLLPFTPIPVRSESRLETINSLLADLTTPMPVLMPKRKLTLILANYLTSTSYVHLERNNL